MKKILILLFVIIILYLASSYILNLVYGESYPLLSGEDCWLPDGEGGWIQHGQPAGDPPDEVSVVVPILVRYIPIFLPALVLILFIFTPLSKIIESPPVVPESEETDKNISESGF